MLRRKFAAVLLLYVLVLPSVTFAQGTAQSNDDVIAKIKDEGMNRSQVMQTLSYMTDVIGPRLTNSPGMKRANEWTRDTLAKWGLQNAHLEAWGPFGRGWTLKRFSAQVVEPQAIPLIAYPKAWSPSIKVMPEVAAVPTPKSKSNKKHAVTPPPQPSSVVTGEVVYLDAKTDADLEKYKGQLKGKIVLFAPPADVKANFTPMGTRLDEKELLALANAPAPGAARQGGRQGQQGLSPERQQEILQQAQFTAKRMNLLVDEGAAVLLDVSRIGTGGTLFVSGAQVAQDVPQSINDLFGGNSRRLSAYDPKNESRMIPQVTVSIEHYNRLIRMIQQGEKLKMTVDLLVEYQDQDQMGYNTIAEIPGTDLKDEIVMLGGHLDSWHAGTGATDNAAGCAVTMEAVRIIQALGLKPRRTIRIALWSGEEQGLIGSRAYVRDHFGAMEGGGNTGQPAKFVAKPEYEKFSAYFNLDNGTGKIRGVYLQGNSGVRDLFSQWLMPFREMGASTLTMSNTGGTDHLSFDAIGLPGFQFIQDEVEYDTLTHHSNQDLYDRIQADDMKQASIIMAAFVYNTAMMDQKLPRKPQSGSR